MAERIIPIKLADILSATKIPSSLGLFDTKTIMAVEYPITFGRDTSKRADIVVFDADRPTVPYLIVEVKQATFKGGKEQLKSYTHATGAPLALWSDGTQTIVWYRKNPNYFVEISDIPTSTQIIDDIIGQPWTIDTLIYKEKEREKDGLTVHAIFHVWRQILEDEGIATSHLFTMDEKPQRCKDYVHNKVFAVDFDEKSVRVARCLNLIAGDGQTNVLHMNTLDWRKWDETVKQQDWVDTYNEGCSSILHSSGSKTSPALRYTQRPKNLWFSVKVDPDSIDLANNKSFLRNVRKIVHFGTGDLEITISSKNDFEKAKPFFFKSYELS